MRPTSFLLLALAACAGGTPVDGGPEVPGPGVRSPIPSMGGQSGSEDILVCIEAERTAITDTAVAPTGATVAADVHLDTLAETWQGALDSGDDVEVTFTVDHASLDFVVYADEEWTVGDPIPYGIDDGCEDRYEVDVDLTIDGPPLLDELVSTQAYGQADSAWMRVYAGLWDEDVTGSTEPATFDLSTAPNPWLLMRFERTTSAQTLSVDWVDDRPDPDDDTATPTYETVTRTSLTAAP